MPFTITETWQSVLLLSVDVPDTVKLLTVIPFCVLKGIFWPGDGVVIFMPIRLPTVCWAFAVLIVIILIQINDRVNSKRRVKKGNYYGRLCLL